ncbi:hypothetical protein K1719_016136 [Acacia pycnantha]|nr:hypothetical protein K1719_016136 [Acacia pycnantha]
MGKGKDKDKAIQPYAPPVAGSKRARASSSSHTTPRGSKFLSPESRSCARSWFLPKSFVPEKVIDTFLPSIPPIEEIIRRRQWKTLVTFPTDSSSTLCREFFTNADVAQIGDTRISWVRGISVPFDAATIESFLDNLDLILLIPLNLCECALPIPLRSGVIGTNYLASLKNCRVRSYHEARPWFYFINSNILPSTNHGDVNLERAVLIYEILGNRNIDIASILSDRITQTITSGRKESKLGHCSLIMQLCLWAGVTIPADEAMDVQLASPIQWSTIDSWTSDASRHARMRTPIQTQPSTHPGPSTTPEPTGTTDEPSADPATLRHLQRQVRYLTRMVEALCIKQNIDPTSCQPAEDDYDSDDAVTQEDAEDHSDDF